MHVHAEPNNLLLGSTSDLLLQLINILNQLLPTALQSIGIMMSNLPCACMHSTRMVLIECLSEVFAAKCY